jgi:hypothetical protein
MSEVGINALRRWTDNAPTPNGETIRELAGRVYDWLDECLEKCKEKVDLDRRDYLYDQYRKRHGDDADIETKILLHRMTNYDMLCALGFH